MGQHGLEQTASATGEAAAQRHAGSGRSGSVALTTSRLRVEGRIKTVLGRGRLGQAAKASVTGVD